MKKRALITGINGMDGSHLSDFLLEKGYDVFGLERRSSVKNRTNTLDADLSIETCAEKYLSVLNNVRCEE